MGVDLALRLTGVCVLDSQGFHPTLINASKLRGRRRLAFIRDALVRLVMAQRPDTVALEGYSIMSENRSFDLGEVAGVIKLLTVDAEIPLIIAAPKQLKKFVTGSGTASKAQMIEHVAKHYGVVTADDNEADAVGLAKLAEVYLTGNSTRRCELEIVHRLQNPKTKRKTRFKKERIHV